MCKISILFDIYWRQLEKKVAPIISLSSPESLCCSDFPRHRMLGLSLAFLQPLQELRGHIHVCQPRLPEPCTTSRGSWGCVGAALSPRRQSQPRSRQKCNCYCKTALHGQRHRIGGRDEIKLGRGVCGISKLTPRLSVLLFQPHCQGIL